MPTIDRLHRAADAPHRLALLTDLYQLTMACGYWKLGRHDAGAVFHLGFRAHPFDGGYTIACGIASAVSFIEHFRFGADDLAYLATLETAGGERLFDDAFLAYLADFTFTGDVDAVREGTAIFPHEPIVRVRGPLLECQLLETALLNLVNFETLIATKATRICRAAEGDEVLEFGLRRAHGIDGGLTASRAAYVGGCTHTSNVLAGKLLGIPVRGTHAHSWVMSFEDEREAFEAYAEVMPGNCVLLVDTYETLEGVRRAIDVGHRLRERGYELGGVRLDSGDLATLSIEARRLLDEAGFATARIVASNDLDEYAIARLKEQNAAIDVWGVGTRLVTAYDQPALGGVYKLSAIRQSGGGAWEHVVKLSEQPAKSSTPGIQQTRRYTDANGFVTDVIVDELALPARDVVMVDPADPTRRQPIDSSLTCVELLEPVIRAGRVVAPVPPIADARERVREQIHALPRGVGRLRNPALYPVGFEAGLYDRKETMIRAAAVAPAREEQTT